MHEKRMYYNLFEANAMIPRLECLFAELARIQHQVNQIGQRAEELGIELSIDSALEYSHSGHPVKRMLAGKLMELSNEYSDKLEEIHRLGVIVDDLDQGIVNFYSWYDGQEIFFSWQYGEPEVSHWHTVSESSTARKSLDHLSPARPADLMLH